MPKPIPTGSEMIPHLPRNPRLLSAIGRVSILHGYLDVMLKRAIKDVTGLEIPEVDRAYMYTGARDLRDHLKKFAKQKLGPVNTANIRLASLMEECARATDQRNRWTHDCWVKIFEPGGKQRVGVVNFGDRTVEKLPTVAKVEALAKRLTVLIMQLNASLMDGGWLKVALDAAATTRLKKSATE